MDEFSRYYSHNQETKYTPDYFQQKDEEKKKLRKLSLWAGFAVLLYILIQNGIFIAVNQLGLVEKYYDNPLFSSGIDILLTVLGIMLPFGVISKKLNKISGEENPIPLGAPNSKRMFFFGIGACLGCIMLSNIISSYFVYFVSLFGYELSSPEINMPEGPLGIILSLLKISVLTAVVEEYSMRGAVMGNLRKYGDMYAIMMAAVVFALMHGNLVQAPFALLAGMALGYFSVKTGTIWTGVIAHALNNGLSVIITYCGYSMPEETVNIIYLYSMYVLIFVGMFCFFIFAINMKNQPLQKSGSLLSTKERLGNFLLTPTMILAMLFMIYITLGTVSK